VRYKLWNVLLLQKEDKYRVLGNVDTKYDALITHIWTLKNTQNDKLQTYYIYKQSDMSHFRLRYTVNNTIWTQV